MTTPEALHVEVPPEQEVGVYANCVSMWFTATEVAVDFAAMLPSELVGAEVSHRAKVVARVKLPPAQAAELARALTDTLQRWDQEFGR